MILPTARQRHPRPVRELVLAAILVLFAASLVRAQSFVTFESGQVRPLALSPSGTKLFAVNTPDNRLEIFDVGSGGLTHTGAVPVGMEPVAVAARSDTEVWVVNHLSDSVSIIDVGSVPPRVKRTLLVCDEPRDIVFGGPDRLAFITMARRGQNCVRRGKTLLDPMLTTPGVGRAIVQVFKPDHLGSTLGGKPFTTIELFGDTPRALAVSPDGNTVYAAVFDSGNRTTTVNAGSVFGSGSPSGLPPPTTNCAGDAGSGPHTGLIVKFNPTTTAWEDELHRNWNNSVMFSLPDEDVFTIDASRGRPTATSLAYTGVGTVIFNMAVNPVSGKVYVSNTDANNAERFEGPGTCSSTVRGHLHEARVTVLQGGVGTPRHLNKHIDYSDPSPPTTVRDKSLATPVGLAVSSDGATLYVAAFGSSKVGVFSTAQLENDSFDPLSLDPITVTGGGPSGLVLDEARSRLYVFTRFDNSISVIDTTTHTETAHVANFNPEPASVVNGRPFLYDAVNTSSNGEASCSACHVFGDFDSLAWDLGNPDNAALANPNPMEVGAVQPFQPLKGPMTTQSLRGLANHGPMHWRGDRTGGTGGGDPLDEDAAFKKFIVAFDGLLGRGGPIADTDMQKFTDFILQVTYPPSPIRALDNSLTPDQQAGHDLYFGRNTDIVRNCNGCHTLNPTSGFFGTQGKMSVEGEPQDFKIPHLRNAYQKVGMFGMPDIGAFKGGVIGNQGPQVRGFGFLHDGSVDTLSRFHSANVFDLNTTEVDQMTEFVLAFDSNLAPMVGQQVTLTRKNARKVGPRIDLMIARAALNECDVVVKGTVLGPPAEQRGWVRQASGMFRSDRVSEPLLDDATLRAQASVDGQERTYTCVPHGSGQRIGVDRDGDGFFDRTELDAGKDPANPASHP